MRRSSRPIGLLLGILGLLCVGFLLYLPSELGMSLAIPPDSSEYAVSLTNLLAHGTFGFTLNGTWYPSRYAPWFSISCLTPGYWLFGGDSLCYHVMIILFAFGTLFLVTRWARLAALSVRWSVIPAVLLLLLPDFAFYSRLVMTEIPYTCLFAASAVVFVRMAGLRTLSVGGCLAAGALVAWCGMVRSTAVPMLLPFAVLILFRHRRWREATARLVALGLPAAACQLANFLYNWKTFGSPTRSGYNFWAPVPCDFPDILFNLSNLKENLLYLPTEPVMVMTALAFVLALALAVSVLRGRLGGVEGNRPFLLLLGYLSFQAVVLLTLYLPYYWMDTRFYLAATVCVVPLGVAALVRFAQAGLPRAGGFAAGALLVGVALSFLQMPTRYSFMTFGRPVWLEEARMTAKVLPSHSVVIQEGDPVIMGHFGFAAKDILLLPYQRRFDYVTYMTATNSIRNERPAPGSWQDKRIPELIARGVCGTPFPVTFLERPRIVRDYLDEGRRVFYHVGRSNYPEWLETIKAELAKQNLVLRPYRVLESPGVVPHPVRRLYDSLVFPGFTMDARPPVKSTYFEIVREGAGR